MAEEPNPMNSAPAEGTEEPSIEEILASIRKIISDEPTTDVAAADAEPEAPVAIAAEPVVESSVFTEDADEVLDLTPFAAAPVYTPATPAPEVFVAEEPEPIDLALDDIAPEPYIPPPAPRPQPTMVDDNLLSARAASAVTDAMQKLKQPEQNPFMQNTVLVGVKTLEQVVEELLRPLLAQWCDEHLPKMVERAVERELARLARRLEDNH